MLDKYFRLDPVGFLLMTIAIIQAVVVNAGIDVVFFFVWLLHVLILTDHDANYSEN